MLRFKVPTGLGCWAKVSYGEALSRLEVLRWPFDAGLRFRASLRETAGQGAFRGTGPSHLRRSGPGHRQTPLFDPFCCQKERPVQATSRSIFSELSDGPKLARTVWLELRGAAAVAARCVAQFAARVRPRGHERPPDAVAAAQARGPFNGPLSGPRIHKKKIASSLCSRRRCQLRQLRTPWSACSSWCCSRHCCGSCPPSVRRAGAASACSSSRAWPTRRSCARAASSPWPPSCCKAGTSCARCCA